MWRAPQGLHAFLRAYYHAKSADWPQNAPFPLAANTPRGVREAAALLRDGQGQGDGGAGGCRHAHRRADCDCRWLPDRELAVYAAEYGRTGFQGGLQSYRVGRVPRLSAELQLFAGRTIDVPAAFISGKSDWGVFQRAGSYEAMQKTACTKFTGAHLIDGAGHWVQQEQPARVAALLVEFLRQSRPPGSAW